MSISNSILYAGESVSWWLGHPSVVYCDTLTRTIRHCNDSPPVMLQPCNTTSAPSSRHQRISGQMRKTVGSRGLDGLVRWENFRWKIWSDPFMKLRKWSQKNCLPWLSSAVNPAKWENVKMFKANLPCYHFLVRTYGFNWHHYCPNLPLLASHCRKSWRNISFPSDFSELFHEDITTNISEKCSS